MLVVNLFQSIYTKILFCELKLFQNLSQYYFRSESRTTLSQDVQMWFPVQLAFAK